MGWHRGCRVEEAESGGWISCRGENVSGFVGVVSSYFDSLIESGLRLCCTFRYSMGRIVGIWLIGVGLDIGLTYISF
jgi:hypothetical protein